MKLGFEYNCHFYDVTSRFSSFLTEETGHLTIINVALDKTVLFSRSKKSGMH